jgi:ferredoxin
MKKLHVDWTRCRGRGLCAELLPELLEPDEWGLPLARGGAGGDVDVPDALADPARRAVRDCPRLALRLSS